MKNEKINYEIFMEKWIKGINEEISFWDVWLQEKGAYWPDEYNKLTAEKVDFIFPELVKEYPLKVLDVGSSIISRAGTITELGCIDLTAVDPCAPIYNALLRKHGVTPYCQTQFSTVECLDDKFEENSFDLIVMTNALDHSFNPLMGIYQMLNVVKVGGTIHLVHAENEAISESYTGFHQWNISCNEKDDFIIWNDVTSYNVNEILKEVAKIKILKKQFYCTTHKINRLEITASIKKLIHKPVTFKKEKVEIMEFLIKTLASLTSETYKNIMNPKISVIIPIYNVEAYIRQCLESVVNQTLKDIEIICIDDCGSDNSMQIVEEFAKKDARIKIIHHENNKGLGCARNTGVKNAIGKYIACVDSDDWISESMLEKAYNKLEETGLDSVWVKVNTYLQEKGSYTTDNYYKTLFEQRGGFIDITPENINNFPVNAWNKVYKKDFIKNHNINWSQGLLYEDLEFYYKFYTQSHKTYLIDELLYIYRWRNNSIMNQTDAGKCRCEDIYDVTENIHDFLIREKLFDKYKTAFSNMLVRNIKLFLYNPHYKLRVIQASKLLLEKISYSPEKHRDENMEFFNQILNCDATKQECVF